jgi:hypothetical protein
MRDKSISNASILWAHMAYFLRNLSAAELDQSTVGILLTAQMFLTNNYLFDVDEKHQATKRKGTARGEIKCTLQIDQTEVFDIFQRHRGPILNWLQTNTASANACFEGVIRVLTFTGWLDREGDSQTSAALSTRVWRTSEKPGYIGRFQPETEISTR